MLVYHFMFGPDYTAGCPSCSAIADGFNGIFAHLTNHDVMFSAVSRASLAKLQAYKRRMGWTFTEKQQREGIEFNYQREPALQPRSGEEPQIPSRATPKGPARRLP